MSCNPSLEGESAESINEKRYVQHIRLLSKLSENDTHALAHTHTHTHIKIIHTGGKLVNLPVLAIISELLSSNAKSS